MADPAALDPAFASENRAWVTITVASITMALATFCVALRSYTRFALLNSFGMDDLAAVVTLFLVLGCGSAVLANVKYGLGRHMATLDPPTIALYFRTFYVSIVMYNASLMSAKVTFLLQYYRVFTLRKMRRIVLGALGLIGCWSLSQLLVAIFNCTPIEKFWLPQTPGTCIPNLPFWYINAAGNIVTDVAIFVLPLPVLSSLKLRKPQKLLLIGIFSLGFFTCAISIIRIQYLHLSPDATFDNVGSSAWSITESSTAIICACLPTLRPFVSKLVPGFLTSRSGKNSKGYYAPHSYAREGGKSGGRSYRERDIESSFGANDDKRPSGSISSRRGVLQAGASTGAADVELGRFSSDADLAEHAARPDGAQYITRMPSRKDSAEQLGMMPSVRTEIGVASQPTWQRMGPNGRGIGVQRDVIVAESEL